MTQKENRSYHTMRASTSVFRPAFLALYYIFEDDDKDEYEDQIWLKLFFAQSQKIDSTESFI